MEWTTTTYQGTYMGGEPSAVRSAIFEIARGVREREDAVGAPATEFYRADGTATTDLTMEDLAPLYAGGLDDVLNAGNIVWANLYAAVLGIRQLVGYPLFSSPWASTWAFATDDTFSTYYTLEIIFGGGAGLVEIEEELGINLSIVDDGNLWGVTGAPRDITDHRYFQFLQDALNALRYVRNGDIPTKTWTGSNSGVYPPYDNRTPEEAWAGRSTVPTSYRIESFFGFSVDLGWAQEKSSRIPPFAVFPIPHYFVDLNRQCQCTYAHIGNIQGQLLSAEVILHRQTFRAIGDPLAPISLNFGVNGSSVVVGAANIGDVAHDVSEDLTPGEAFVIEGTVLTVEPAANPFGSRGTGTGLRFGNLTAFLDISSQITNLPEGEDP